MAHRKTDPPKGILKTDTRDSARYRYMRYLPSSDLASYIEHFWVVEWDFRGMEPELAETLPHPSVHLIFEDGKSRIMGPHRAKFSRMIDGRGGVFAAKFTPGGFHPFAKGAVSRFADTTVSLRKMFGVEGGALDRRVLAETKDAPRIAIIEKFLRDRRPTPGEDMLRATRIVYSVAKDRSILKVGHLVDRYALTMRTLQRLFSTCVGVSPKWVIQRYRLHEAAEQLASGGSLSQTGLAIDLGYSDQAHFIRDFRAIVGMPPATYARMSRDRNSTAP